LATMNVSLPDEMKEWVEERASTGRFANVSDYIRDVLRREQAAVDRFQAVIDEARASGTVELNPHELLADIKQSNRERVLASAEAIKAESLKADDAA
jgi:antitoxin ParD1/3/4